MAWSTVHTPYKTSDCEFLEKQSPSRFKKLLELESMLGDEVELHTKTISVVFLEALKSLKSSVVFSKAESGRWKIPGPATDNRHTIPLRD